MWLWLVDDVKMIFHNNILNSLIESYHYLIQTYPKVIMSRIVLLDYPMSSLNNIAVGYFVSWCNKNTIIPRSSQCFALWCCFLANIAIWCHLYTPNKLLQIISFDRFEASLHQFDFYYIHHITLWFILPLHTSCAFGSVCILRKYVIEHPLVWRPIIWRIKLKKKILWLIIWLSIFFSKHNPTPRAIKRHSKVTIRRAICIITKSYILPCLFSTAI